ncbi:hypothetical protein B0A50_05099 [Salinomyces thailandicus]|uniref:Uncharacterized protein n=1 Tax=Salinomyces thailandicus TaxID=706561 RepID=A0A4U0TVF5_9PEZI|nr:hypothetical protein B0A50_05099 [Salinomyces thailandica]
MPNLKLFNRRKSTASALDFPPEDSPAPVQSTFRVLERPEKATLHSFDGKAPHRPYNSPLATLRGKSVDNLGLVANRDSNSSLDPNWALKRDRASGGTTNSSTSGYYASSAASARYSSSSTVPSSVEQEREAEEEELFAPKSTTAPMVHSISADADIPLPPPPSFRSRAVRAISFGQKHNRIDSRPNDAPADEYDQVSSAPQVLEHRASPPRNRSMTESSYASTAVPTDNRASLSLGAPDFGDDDDFGNMFAGIGKNKSKEELVPQRPSPIGVFHRTVRLDNGSPRTEIDEVQESEPMYPPKTHSRVAFTPPPNGIRSVRGDSGSPYDWNTSNAQDRLQSSPALSSPPLDDGLSPSIAPAFLGRSKGYAPLPDRIPSPDRTSLDEHESFIEDHAREQSAYGNRQSHLDDGDRWARRVRLDDGPVVSNTPSKQASKTAGSRAEPPRSALKQAVPGASRQEAVSPYNESDEPPYGSESTNATPRASKPIPSQLQDQSLFDSSPVGPPSRAIRPDHGRTETKTPKRMTKAQYDALQRDQEKERSTEEMHAEDEYDEEDDSERTAQAIKQRRKQEANMAVYRQQMKKVTGGGPSGLPGARPSLERTSQSAPASGVSGLHFGGIGGVPPADSIRGNSEEEEDDDVPLGILQAHGFPGASRPPIAGTDGQRRASGAPSVVANGAGQTNLPPFARRLPQDPYFGASLVNPSNRESMAFSSAQSTYGGMSPQQSPMGHPGGLVGVIAGEERAKAARRGSPNPATGAYNSLPSNMPHQMPSMPRTMSMGSVAAPSVYHPSGYMHGMPQMPMTPQSDPAQAQMQQFMQMQMQFMQSMMAMQQQQQLGLPTPQFQAPGQDYLGVPLAGQRPMSTVGQPQGFPGVAQNQGRAMTMMAPPPKWERASAQQRPVSALPDSYTPSGLAAPGQGYTPSIAPSERSNVGMPTRYRPVQTNGETGTPRSHSMTSSMTLQAFTNQQRPESRQGQLKSTIRVVDKPKGSPKITTRQVSGEEDEDDGWAEMAKKRNEKKFGWRRENKTSSGPTLGELYNNDFE